MINANGPHKMANPITANHPIKLFNVIPQSYHTLS
jgi:hypothetical protein